MRPSEQIQGLGQQQMLEEQQQQHLGLDLRLHLSLDLQLLLLTLALLLKELGLIFLGLGMKMGIQREAQSVEQVWVQTPFVWWWQPPVPDLRLMLWWRLVLKLQQAQGLAGELPLEQELP